jgi:hypothetical protein
MGNREDSQNKGITQKSPEETQRLLLLNRKKKGQKNRMQRGKGDVAALRRPHRGGHIARIER